jgi:hypothetical protein
MRGRQTFDLPIDGCRIKGNLHASNRTRHLVILVLFKLAIQTERHQNQAKGTVRRGTTTTVPSGS